MSFRKVLLLLFGITLSVGGTVSAHASEDTKHSEVSITFVEPEDEGQLREIEQAREEYRKTFPKEIKTLYVDAPGDYSTYTTFVYDESAMVMRSERK